jgi:hypothetical protein
MTEWFDSIKKEFIDKAKIHGSVTNCETELNTDGTGDVPHVLLKIRINKPKLNPEKGKES